MKVFQLLWLVAARYNMTAPAFLSLTEGLSQCGGVGAILNIKKQLSRLLLPMFITVDTVLSMGNAGCHDFIKALL